MVKVHGLGRGLDALIPRDDRAAVEQLPIERISRNRHQPRERFDAEPLAELAESIRTHGVIQPIVVRATVSGYELIAGERRLRAARLAGLTTIPAVVRNADESDQLQVALIENLQRTDLGPMEEAHAYRELTHRFGLSQEEVARRVGKSRVAITNALRLLELDADVQAALRDGRITEGHGRALASLPDAAAQRAALEQVVGRQLSVRQAEELVRRYRGGPQRRARVPLSPDVAELEAALRTLLATRVGIVRSRRGGRIVIDFHSDEELDRIHAVISRGAA